jgi:hypothetical protein
MFLHSQILLFKVYQFPRLVDIQIPIFLSPAVIGLLADIQLTGSLNHDHVLVQ